MFNDGAHDLTINGTGMDDDVELNLLLTLNTLTIDTVNDVVVTDDITTVGDLSVTNANNVDLPVVMLESTGVGDITLATDGLAVPVAFGTVTLLGDVAGNNVIQTETGSLSLGDIQLDPASTLVGLNLVAEGGVGVPGNITLQSVDLDPGAPPPAVSLDIDMPEDGSPAEALIVNGFVTASFIVLDAEGGDDTLTFESTVDTSSTIAMQGIDINRNTGASAASLTFNGDVTSASFIHTHDIVGDINIGTDVDIAANGDDLVLDGDGPEANKLGVSVGRINFTDTTGGTNILSSVSRVQLAATAGIVDNGGPGGTGPAVVRIDAGADGMATTDDIVLSSVELDGANQALLDINLDTGADDEADLSASGTITAGTIDIDGNGTNDDINLDGTVSATDGGPNGQLTINNVDEIDLATGVDLLTVDGDIDVATDVTSIELSGAGPNTISAGTDAGVEANATVAAVTDNGGGASDLNVLADGDVTLAAVTIGGNLFAQTDQDDDTVQTLMANGAIMTGMSVGLSGGLTQDGSPRRHS